jgi:hypothetical protein
MAHTLKLTSPTVLESDLQRHIVEYLRHEQARGRVGWFARINGGKARLMGGFWVKFYRLWIPAAQEVSAGYSDLHGLYGPRSGSPGLYFALEVKQPGEKPTDAQTAFLAAVRESGGVGAVVRSIEDVKSLLFGEIDILRDSRPATDDLK